YSTSLSDLHFVIQDVMGWFDGHLHYFQFGKKQYADLNTDMDPKRYEDELLVPVGTLLKKKGQKFHYVYDFGDDWRHTIVLEKRLKASEDILPLCLEGERACPLEDCGGVWGHERILDYFQQKEKDRDPDLVDWVPDDYDPSAFDLKEVNELLREGPPTSQTALIGKAKPQYSFFLNIYPGQGFSRCVHCGAKTKLRKFRFLIDAYQHGLQSIPMDTKFCAKCKIVVVQEKKLNLTLKSQLIADYDIGEIKELQNLGKDDYFVVGTLDKSYKTIGALEEEPLEDILKVLSNFRERLNVVAGEGL
ncbi:MAG: plasmid pRiA4b ORF-3 family protein, partial [Planctomycetota bacterium]|nr:plasmid pRiA4b ORF-3 family protein [Planctomycetota bacterium]